MDAIAWILGITGSGFLALQAWTLSRLSHVSEDVAVLRQQLTPAGEKALRAVVHDHEHRITILESRHQ